MGKDDDTPGTTELALQPLGKDIVFTPFSNFTLASTTCLNGEKKRLLYTDFATEVKKYDITDYGVPTALGMTLYALAMVSTSTKVDIDDKEPLLTAKIDLVDVTLTYGKLKEFVNSLPALKGHSNKLRVFARTFEEEYLTFARQHKNSLPTITRANNHGIAAEHSYLAADFVQTSNLLTEFEQAVKLEGRAAATRSTDTTRASVVNLKYLGGSAK